jgi:hypothetical protein
MPFGRSLGDPIAIGNLYGGPSYRVTLGIGPGGDSLPGCAKGGGCPSSVIHLDPRGPPPRGPRGLPRDPSTDPLRPGEPHGEFAGDFPETTTSPRVSLGGGLGDCWWSVLK